MGSLYRSQHELVFVFKRNIEVTGFEMGDIDFRLASLEGP
jgi:hypothetical protein